MFNIVLLVSLTKTKLCKGIAKIMLIVMSMKINDVNSYVNEEINDVDSYVNEDKLMLIVMSNEDK